MNFREISPDFSKNNIRILSKYILSADLQRKEIWRNERANTTIQMAIDAQLDTF